MDLSWEILFKFFTKNQESVIFHTSDVMEMRMESDFVVRTRQYNIKMEKLYSIWT